MEPVRAAYSAEQYESARDQLTELRKSDASNAHLYGLELAVVQQALANPKAAVSVMRKLRDALDRLSLVDNTIVIFFSDNGGAPTTGAGICRWPGVSSRFGKAASASRLFFPDRAIRIPSRQPAQRIDPWRGSPATKRNMAGGRL